MLDNPINGEILLIILEYSDLDIIK